MAACRAISSDTEAPGRKGDVVEKDDDPLWWDVKIGGKLKNGAAGQIHEGLRF